MVRFEDCINKDVLNNLSDGELNYLCKIFGIDTSNCQPREHPALYITKHMVDGFTLEVEGFPERRYIGYSLKDGISRYRHEFGLQHKKFDKVYL